MAQFSTQELQHMVEQLLLVVDPKVSAGLDDLRYVLSDGIMPAGNPALYLNKNTKQGLLMIINGKKVGDLTAERGNTVAVRPGSMNRIPTVYGILLHEMAHAWLERCNTPNTEANAYLFEIEWVCTLAARTGHPYSEEMKKGLGEYFDARTDFGAQAKDHLAWTQRRLNL